MSRTLRLIIATGLAALVSACAATTGGPNAMSGGPAASADPTVFRPADFAWSMAKGKSQLAGRVTYKQGATRYTCAGATVILTPETPWSKRRMEVLYKSAERSALPSAEVRARTPSAPPGDSGPFIKRAVCDAMDKFSYAGLPDGAWFLITVAKPVAAQGDAMALMRRVVTKDGKLTVTEL